MALACVLSLFCSELTCYLPGHAFLTTSLNTQLPPPHIRFLLMVIKATLSTHHPCSSTSPETSQTDGKFKDKMMKDFKMVISGKGSAGPLVLHRPLWRRVTDTDL